MKSKETLHQFFVFLSYTSIQYMYSRITTILPFAAFYRPSMVPFIFFNDKKDLITLVTKVRINNLSI